jgi:hypothetical protein
VSFDDWMLALHVLSAFSLVAGVILFWALVVVCRRTDTPEGTLRLGPATKVGNATVGLGMGGTILFGLWLAFSVGGYDIWDGWILAALVLWLVAAELGRRTGAAYMEGTVKAQELEAAGQTGPSAELLAVNRTSTGLLMHTLTSIVVLLIIIDMVWKPGARVLADLRPDSWNFPLFMHVLGAMVLVGGLAACASALGFARGDSRLLRLGYWSLLAVSLPGYVVMRIGAEWIASKEGLDDVDDGPTWLGIGFLIADTGALVLLIALVVGGIGVYRMRQGKGAGLLKVTLVLALVLVAAYLVAVWAMSGKPD